MLELAETGKRRHYRDPMAGGGSVEQQATLDMNTVLVPEFTCGDGGMLSS
jgi:hypothetical protein